MMNLSDAIEVLDCVKECLAQMDICDGECQFCEYGRSEEEKQEALEMAAHALQDARSWKAMQEARK